MYHIGIDISKDHLDIRILDARGNPQGRAFRVDNRPRAILDLLNRLPEPTECRLYFEATGGYGKQLVRLLDGKVAALYEINPTLIKKQASTMTATKTDSADATAIADAGHTLSLKHPNVLKRYQTHYEQENENLQVYLTEFDRLRKQIAGLKQRRQQLAHNPAPAAKTMRNELRAELKHAEDRKRKVEKAIEEHSDREDVHLVQSIKGIGRTSAAVLCRCIGDIQRFDSDEALKGHLGIYPARRQSGKHEKRSRMAKHGNDLARHMLFNCAKSAARHNPACKPLFDRMVAEGRKEPDAWGAVMRKLVQIVYGVLKNQTPWNPQHHLTPNG